MTGRMDSLYDFAETLDLVKLGAALHFLRHDHNLVLAARLGLELGDERRAIANVMKEVSLDVHEAWTDLAVRHVRSGPAATFQGVAREPVRCGECHRRLTEQEAA